MSNSYSSIGKARLQVYAGLYVINVVVLILASKVNQFQDFFFVADLFPLGLSITTLVILTAMLVLDFSLVNAFTGRPLFEIGLLSTLTIFWLAFNAFSTSRWSHVPMACSSIPADFSDEKSWCRDLQALKAFVWIEWVLLLGTLLLTLRFVLKEHRRGNTHVWATALSRYAPHSTTRARSRNMRESVYRGSSFWAGDFTYRG